MTNVVGLCGKKGAGKDTFAQILISRYGYRRIAFADALYREVREAYNVDNSVLSNRETKELPYMGLALVYCADSRFVEVAVACLGLPGESLDAVLSKPRSPRVIMQLWGTEYRRKLDKESYWRDIVVEAITTGPADQLWVITDVRFKDEARTVESLGGFVGRVLRPGMVLSAEALLTLNHPSEIDMDDYDCRFTVENQEGAPELLEAWAEKVHGWR